MFGQSQRHLVDIAPAHCVQRRGKPASGNAALAFCRRECHFETFQFVRIFAPSREVGRFRGVGKSGLPARLARFAQLSFEGTGPFGEPVHLSLLPLDLFDLLAGQIRQGAGQGLDSLHDADKFLPAARKSDGTFNQSEPVGGGFRVVELRLQFFKLIRAPLEVGVPSHRLLDILRRLVEVIPFAAATLGGHTGEQVRGDPVQIESAGHLPPNFRGDVGGAVPRRIDQIPEVQKKTAGVVGWGQVWRNVVFAASLPACTRPLALSPPRFSVQFEFARYRRRPRGTAVFPVQSLDRAADARLADPVRTEHDVEARSRRFDFKGLADSGQPIYGKPFQFHDGSLFSRPESMAFNAAFPERNRRSRRASSDRGSVALR